MYRAGRTAWELVAIGAATAVGITTRDPGFIIITFLGALVVPRGLGLTPRRCKIGAVSDPAPLVPMARAGVAAAPVPPTRRRTPRHPRPPRNRPDDRRGGGCSPPRVAPTMHSQ